MSAALLAAKLALGPILLPQAHWLRRTALRLPEAAGAREGVVGRGAAVARVLVVGDSSAAGVGVADQAQALALPLAHRLNEQLGGAVGWQLVARTGVNAAEARELVAQAPLQGADVVVTALGVNDVSSQSSPTDFVEALEQLWDELRCRTGARWPVFCGLPPMHMLTAVPHPLRWYLGRYADGLDQALHQWSEARGHGYLALRWAEDASCLAEDGFHPGPALYPQWAGRLAELLLGHREKWARR
jgi:lysophospholipase L1-like esterase